MYTKAIMAADFDIVFRLYVSQPAPNVCSFSLPFVFFYFWIRLIRADITR